jgi:ATP-dependent protease ClpP protease subunit
MQFVKNYTKGDQAVEMELYDSIGIGNDDGGRMVGISGTAFSAEMNYLVHSAGVPTIKVRINSPGGSIIDGLSVIASMIRINQSGVAKVDTYVDGIAGSMAGIIAIFGNRRFAFDFSRIMVHAPSGGDETSREQLKQMLLTLLSGQTADQDVKKIMSGDVDQWYTANEAMKRGYIDEIISTGRAPIGIAKTESMRAVMASASNIIQNLKSEKMDISKVRAKLNIGETENIENAIDSLMTKVAENAELRAKTEKLAADLEIANQKSAEHVVDAAISAGKFDAKERDNLINQAKAAPDMFSAIVRSTMTVANRVPIGTGSGTGSATTASENGFSVDALGVVNGPGLPENGLSFRDLDKKELSAKVKNAAPDVWQKAYDVEFAKN